jgi:hypothetical protein
MGWETSDRRASLPANWPTVRAQRLAIDGHRCTATMRSGNRCRDRATDVDHAGGPDDHDVAALRSLCSWHHDRKSSREGAAARVQLSERRRPEAHPGLIV